ncbi:hypothetical protein BGZ92_000852, partial [Podila epicladia]
MKFLSPRLVTYVAIASITCLLSTSAVIAVAEDAIANPNTDPNAEILDQGFESRNYGGKKGHHHHYKKKKYHNKPKHLRVLNLVCDKVIIDKLVCKTRLQPVVCANPVADSIAEPVADSIAEPIAEPITEPVAEGLQTPFEPLNNGGAPNVTQVYIVMDSPCSRELPPLCSAALEIAGEASENQQGTASGVVTGDDPDAVTDDDPDADTNNEADDDTVDLWPKKHQNPHRRHKKGKYHRHKQHNHIGHKKQRHPYKDLCVAVGEFCGSNLYGCYFSNRTLYSCKAVGENPEVLLPNAKVCGGTDEANCRCPISKKGKPVCGSQLDKSCNADPTAIYYCPDGDGSEPKILKKCPSGTQCHTDKYDNTTCGYENCKCSGDAKACSDQFPDYCKLEPNSVYKCENGYLKLDKT